MYRELIWIYRGGNPHAVLGQVGEEQSKRIILQMYTV